MAEHGARRRPIRATLLAGLTLWAAGCEEKREPIPPGSFRAVVEDIVEDDLVRVQRITLTARGLRVVSLTTDGLDQATANRDTETDMMTAQVVFVADLIRREPRSENVLRWLARIKAQGVTVGGPTLSPAGSAESLDDLMLLRLNSGFYPLAQDISLGHLGDKELILRVE